jgi:zinc protease
VPAEADPIDGVARDKPPTAIDPFPGKFSHGGRTGLLISSSLSFGRRVFNPAVRSSGLFTAVPIYPLAAMNLSVCVAFVLLAAIALPGSLHAQSRPAAPAAPALENTLTNGLRYVIQPHGAGLGRVSVRLVVEAGSLDERDDERGYAHFVEHMAFNGSRHFPPGKVVGFLQKLGLTFGADLWAGTSFTHTIYKLDLPAGHAAELGEALRVLRDFADGISFPANEVEREKGVVLSELAARDTAGAQTALQELSTLFENTPLPRRSPAGTSETIQRATSSSLRGFYQRCYHARRMTVVVTGDISAESAQAEVTRAFDSLASAAAPVPPATLDLPDVRGPRAHVVVRPAESAATVKLVVVTQPDVVTPAGRRAVAAGHIVLGLLDHRLAERRARDRNQFGNADALVQSGEVPRFRPHVLSASTVGTGWPAAVRLLEQELRRARDHGFGDAEVRERVAAYLAQRRADRDAAAGQTPDLMAERIVETVQSGRPWRALAEDVAESEAALAGFTPAAAQAALRSLFSGDRLHILLFAPGNPDGGKAAVMAAYRESSRQPLKDTSVPSGGDLTFKYTDFGSPGTVAERRPDPGLGIERVRFANGVMLNLRASVTEPGRFRLTARFGRGVMDLPRNRPGLAHLASHLIGESDLGLHPHEEIRRLFHLRAVEYHAGYAQQLAIAMTGPVHELPFALQFLTAQITDVRLEPSRLPAALSDYGACVAGRRDTGSARVGSDLMYHMTGGDPRFRETPPSETQDYPFAEMVDWARRHWLEGALEIGVIGDFDPAAAVANAAATVGTLPVRRPPAGVNAADIATLRRQPAHDTRREPVTEPVASVIVAWPAPALPDPRRQLAARLATDILEDRLQKTLREELGATYSPSAGVLRETRYPELGLAVAALTFDPAQAGELTQRAIGIADKLARQGATPEEFDRLRAPLASSVVQSLQSNDWWLDNILATAQTAPAALEYARTAVAVVARLERGEVNRMAAGLFRSETASSLTLIPAGPAAGAVAGSPAAAPTASGKKKYHQGDLAGALEDFERAIALDATFAAAYTNRSAVRIQRGDAAGAIADCTKAIELDSGIALAYSNRGAARLELGDLDNAIADCTAAIRLEPANSNAHNNRALARARKGDAAGALADLSSAIELNPGNAQAFANRARQRLEVGELDGAAEDALTAIELRPDYAEPHSTLGLVCHQRGDLSAAAVAYSKAIALNPNLPDLHRNRGNLRLMTGALEGALADFNEAIRVNPRDADALGNRGILKHGRKDYDGALADFSAAVAAAPAHAAAYANRAAARHALNDYDGAIADSNQALALDQNNADAYTNRGYARYAKGDFEGAIADYTRAIALKPGAAAIYRNRAEARKAKGDRFGAMDDFDQALKLSTPMAPPPGAPPAVARSNLPSTPPPQPPPATKTKSKKKSAPQATDAAALVRSGLTKRSQRNYTGALADFDRAIQLQPDLAEAYVARGSVRALRNDPTGAIADHTKALALKPDHAAALVERGNVRRTQGEHDLAFADYDQAIALQPTLITAHYNRGLAHQAKPEHPAAIRDFDAALTLNPGYVPAYNARGFSRQVRGNFAGAIADYSAAIDRSPTYAPAYFNRAFARQVKGELAAALADYNKLIELAPTYVGAHSNRGNVRHATGDFEGALADYEQAMALTRTSTHYPRLFRTLVQRRLQRGDPGPDLAAAIRTWPAGWTKTMGRFLTGELTESQFLAASTEGAGRTPLSRPCEAHYFAGMVRLLAKDDAGARAHFEKSAATNQIRLSAFILARAELARLSARAGENRAAPVR